MTGLAAVMAGAILAVLVGFLAALLLAGRRLGE